MAQSRQPAFYAQMGIADTVTGRLDMLCLHMVLLSQRLAVAPEPLARSLNQEVFDAFAADLDRALREIGIGDTSVPKRKKKMVHGYFGQLDALVPPLEANDREALTTRIAERYFEGEAGRNARMLTAYVADAHDRLSQQSFDQIVAAALNWPDPEGYVSDTLSTNA